MMEAHVPFEVLGTVLATLVGILALARKGLLTINTARVESASAGATTDVIEGMRTELARMTEQNSKLAKALNELQLEVVKLSSENAELLTTVRHLHSEVRFLRSRGITSDFADLHPGG